MTTNHIDQLNKWYEEAEKGAVQKGDTVIAQVADGQYNVFTAFDSVTQEYDKLRILARAPKPKPAWHDAVAVIAEVHAFDLPRVFVKGDDGIWNDALTGRGYSSDALSHVTPLIEAKVTDEMVERGAQASERAGVRYLHPSEVREIITAALGLESA